MTAAAGTTQHPRAEVERRIERAHARFPEWRRLPHAERGLVLARVADRLERDVETHARLMVGEMRKPIAQARAEARKSAAGLRDAAGRAQAALAERRARDGSRIVLQPLGVILGVMPWNFPYWQVVRFAAPAMMAGNTVVVKHASNVTGCLLALEELFEEAGAEGAFVALAIPASRVAEVVADPRVRGVSVTGSDEAGARVAEAAGRAIKPVVLELGGSDPFIVLEDAEVAKVAREAAKARCVNSGQSCIAAKRFLVQRDVHDEFLRAFRLAMEGLVVGDPMDDLTDVGPLARRDLAEKVEGQVRDSVQAGARVVTGGRLAEGSDRTYLPTVLAAVRPGMRAWDEEVFGPVAPVMPFDADAEAVALANASPFGLGASVWTRNQARAAYFTERLEAGMAFVNGPVVSDPRRPFGGIKRSGFGRELGDEGFLSFVNVKSVVGAP